MNRFSLTGRQLAYEIVIILRNFYIPFFGMIFPLLLTIFISNSLEDKVPSEVFLQVRTQVMLTMIPMIGLSSFFLGEVAIFTFEVEKKIAQRLEVFGFTRGGMFATKYLAFLIFTLCSTAVFFVGTKVLSGYESPTILGFIEVNLLLLFMAGVMFVIAHSLALVFKSFNIAYGVGMVIYFGIMFLSGMLGLRTEDMPGWLKTISEFVPYSYGDIYYNIWIGKSVELFQYTQAVVLFTAIAAILYIIASKRKWF